MIHSQRLPLGNTGPSDLSFQHFLCPMALYNKLCSSGIRKFDYTCLKCHFLGSKRQSDCNLSLKLDAKYVKALQRRAAARVALDKLEDAELDFLRVLEIEPKNKESQAELAKVRLKLNKVEKVSFHLKCRIVVSYWCYQFGQFFKSVH